MNRLTSLQKHLHLKLSTRHAIGVCEPLKLAQTDETNVEVFEEPEPILEPNLTEIKCTVQCILVLDSSVAYAGRTIW